MDSENEFEDPEAGSANVEDLVAPTPTPAEEEREERAGLYLASLFALALPLLIVLAITLPSNSPFRGDDNSSSTGTGLDRLEVAGQEVETVDGEIVSVEVAGEAERNGEESGSAEAVEVQIGDAELLEADAGASGDTAAGNEASTSPSLSDDGADSTATASPHNDDADNSNNIASNAEASDARTARRDTPTEVTTTSTAIAARKQTTTTVKPTTTTTTTTKAPEIKPKATTSTTSSSTTSTSTTSTTTTQAPEVESVEFAQRIDIGRIGETSLQFRFSSATTSPYVVTIRSGSTVVATTSGTANAGTLINETVSGLTAGTDYTVQVTLTGPPAATSPRVAFRTSGGTPDAVDTQVTLGGVGVVDVRSDRFQVNYTSNVCANGSFVIREQGGGTVGSNAGQAAGCTTRHLAIPGFWTAKLKPNTVYRITITVEANGAGQGGGNTASTSLTVTTSS